MRIYGIVGNRSGFTYERIKQVLDKHCITSNDTIVSGGAIGVDTYAQRYAKEIGAKLIIYYPNPSENSPNRYFTRNLSIALECDELIAFSKKSRGGTYNTINHVRVLNKKVSVFGD